MKCRVCKTNESEKDSIFCSDKCDKINQEIIKLCNKYTPTNGCENCLGDLYQGCTDECKDEFKKATEFVRELYSLIRIT